MTATRLHGDDTGCTSCGHPEGCPCSCCTPEEHAPLCPDCTNPLEDEGLSLYCGYCRRPVSFAEAIPMGEAHDN